MSENNLLNRIRSAIGRTFQREIGGEIGGTGTQVWDGMILGEEYKTALSTEWGQEGLTTYNRMRKSDPVIRASLKAIELKIRSGHWYVEPVSEAAKDVEISDFVNDVLFNKMSTPWAEIIRLILTMLPFGFSVFEKVFKEEEGKIVWDKWAFRSQTSIQKFQLKNGEKGILQNLQGESVGSGGTEPEIPIEKLLIFTHEKEGDNWRGVSLLRSAYKPWFFKEALEKIEAIGYERAGVGVPKTIFPPNPKPADVALIKTLLQNLRANEKAYLALPSGFDVEMLDMKGATARDPAMAIERKNWEIAVNVLAPHIVLGQKNTGSFALAKELSDEFNSNNQSYAEEIADIINAHAIKQLVDINFGEQEEYPKLGVSGIKPIDPQTFSFALERLTTAGLITADVPTEKWVRTQMNMPDLEEETIEKIEEKEELSTKIQENLAVKPEVIKKEEVPVKKEEKIQASEPYWRKLTAAESKIDFKKIEDAMDKMEGSFLKSVSKLINQERESLLEFAESVASSGDPSTIINYIPRYKDEIADEIYDLYLQAFEKGKILAANELGIQAPITKSLYQNTARARAMSVADKMVNDLISEVSFSLTDLMEKGISKSVIASTLGDITTAKIATILSRASSNTMVGAINTGRFSVFEERPEVIHSLQRSEILDYKTCNFCISIDGRSVYPGDDITQIEQFHHQCRGIWVAIGKDEAEKPKVTDIPESLRERVGTLPEFKQMEKPMVLKDSLAEEFLSGR